MRPARFPLLCFFVTMLAGCASSVPRLVLPVGPGTPFPDYAPLFETAVSECRGVRRFEALLRLRGQGGGVRLSGRVRAALAIPGSVRFEGLAPFGVGFYLVARPGEATLLLVRESRVLTDVPAADLLESLTGVPLGPDDLRAVLMGCLVPDPHPMAGRSYGELIAVDLAGGAIAYLRQIEGQYRLVAGTRDGLSIEYSEFVRGIPRRVRVLSDETLPGSSEPLTDLTVALSQLDMNIDIPDAVFAPPTLPADVVPMTLDELRRGVGPLEAPPETPEPSSK